MTTYPHRAPAQTRLSQHRTAHILVDGLLLLVCASPLTISLAFSVGVALASAGLGWAVPLAVGFAGPIAAAWGLARLLRCRIPHWLPPVVACISAVGWGLLALTQMSFD